MAFEKRSEYSQKLRDPRWQKMRLQVMNRDEFSCQFCGDPTTTLNVHHRWYVAGREPWDYPLDSLLTLCEVCHAEETASLRESEAYFVHVLKTAGAISLSFDALAAPFHGPPVDRLGPDAWDVLAFGIGELLTADQAQWDGMRERYYAHLRKLRAEQGVSE